MVRQEPVVAVHLTLWYIVFVCYDNDVCEDYIVSVYDGGYCGTSRGIGEDWTSISNWWSVDLMPNDACRDNPSLYMHRKNRRLATTYIHTEANDSIYFVAANHWNYARYIL